LSGNNSDSEIEFTCNCDILRLRIFLSQTIGVQGMADLGKLAERAGNIEKEAGFLDNLIAGVGNLFGFGGDTASDNQTDDSGPVLQLGSNPYAAQPSQGTGIQNDLSLSDQSSGRGSGTSAAAQSATTSPAKPAEPTAEQTRRWQSIMKSLREKYPTTSMSNLRSMGTQIYQGTASPETYGISRGQSGYSLMDDTLPEVNRKALTDFKPTRFSTRRQQPLYSRQGNIPYRNQVGNQAISRFGNAYLNQNPGSMSNRDPVTNVPEVVDAMRRYNPFSS
jgi:hypothetical protein